MLGTPAESKDVVPAALAGSVELAQQVVNKLEKELASTRSKKQEERKNFAAALTKKLQDEEVIKIFFKRHNVDYKGDIADSIEKSTRALVQLHKNGTGNQATGLLDYKSYGEGYVACVARIQKLTGEIAEAHVAFENARAKVQAAIEEAKSKTWLGTLPGQYIAKIMEEIKELRKDNQEFRYTLAEQSKQIASLLSKGRNKQRVAKNVYPVGKKTRRWCARLWHSGIGKSLYLGTFDKKADAMNAYNAKVKEMEQELDQELDQPAVTAATAAAAETRRKRKRVSESQTQPAATTATAAAAETRRKRKRVSESQTQPPATTATAAAAETRCKRKRVSDSQTQPATTATAAQTPSSLFLM